MPARINPITSFSVNSAKLWKKLAWHKSEKKTAGRHHHSEHTSLHATEISKDNPKTPNHLIPNQDHTAKKPSRPSSQPQNQLLSSYLSQISSIASEAVELEREIAKNLPPDTTILPTTATETSVAAKSNTELFTNADVQANEALEKYLLALKHNNCSPATIRNYKSDIKQFCDFSENDNLEIILTKPKLQAFIESQKAKQLALATIKRKLISIAQFSLWAKRGKLLGNPDMPSGLSTANEQELFDLIELRPSSALKQKTKAGSRQADIELPFAAGSQPFGRIGTLIPYLNLGLMVLFILGLGYFSFRQFKEADISLAFPTTLTRPRRMLSFQGRLTDQADTPIVAGTAMRFRLFNDITGGTQLWDSNACTVDPDVDGIFNANLGAGAGAGSDLDDCGAEIADSVFTENSNVWLQVTIGAETLTPRQPIRTVAYALNSETLQGFPASASAVENTVLIMNNTGEVVLGNSTPKIKATGDSFTLEGKAFTIQTPTGSDTDITVNAGRNIIFDAGIAGTGGSLVSRDYIEAPGATLSATYAGGTALTLRAGPTATADIMRWQNSAGANLGVINAGGDFGIGTDVPEQKLTVSDSIQLGVSDATRYIYFDNGTSDNSGFRYNTSTNKMQFSHDGLTWSDFIDTTGVVTSVSNIDGTLTITPTTGSVIASLNLGNNNTWTGLQTFNNTYTDIAQYLRHEGDTDTYLQFTPDVVGLTAGGKNVLTLDALAGQNLVTVGDGTDIDTQILTNSSLVGLFVEGSSGRVGINGVTAPAQALEIGGSGTARIGGLTASMPVKTNANKDLVSAAIDLTTDVTGILPILNGGTNSTATPTLGGVAYGSGTAYAFTAVGSSGEVLKSNGSATPTWVDVNTLVIQNWTRSAEGVLYPTTANDVVAATSSATTVLTATQQTAALLAARIGGITDATSVVIDGNGNMGIGNVAPAAKLSVGPSSQFQVNAAGNIAAATGITSSGNITFSGLLAGATDSVVTENAGLLEKRAIDNRVWGSSLVDGSGTTGYNTYWSDANTLAAEQYVSVTRGGLGGDVTAVGAGELLYSTAATTYDTLAAGTAGFVLQSTGASAPSWVDVNTIVTNHWDKTSEGVIFPRVTNDVIAATSSATTVLTATQQTSALLAARIGGTTNGTVMVVDGNGNVGIGNVAPSSKFTVGAANEFQVNTAGNIAAATGITSSGDITFSGLNPGTTDSVITESSGLLGSRVIDNRVWGSSLIDGTGSTGYNAYWTDTNTLAAEQYVNVTRGGLGADVTAAGAGELLYSTAATTYDTLAAGTAGFVLSSNGAGAPSWADVNSLINNYWTRSTEGVVSPATLNDVVAATSSATTVLTATQQDSTLLAARLGGTTAGTSVVIDGNGLLGVGNLAPNNKFTVGATNQFQVSGTGAIAAATGISSSGNITFSGLLSGTSDSVITESSGLLEKRAIDSRVWGSALIDGTGTTGYNAYWTDANTLGAEQYVNVTRGGLGGDITAAGAGEIIYSTSTTAYDTLAAGTSGFVLTSGGAGAPTWTDATLVGTNYWTRSAEGILFPEALNDGIAATSSATTVLTATQQNVSLLAARIGGTTAATSVVIDGNGQLGVGDVTPGAKFAVGPNSEFQVNAAGAIAAATGITSSGNITFSGINTGATNSVVTLNAGLLEERTIDSRVWGSGLTDGVGTTNYNAYWLDANTLGSEQFINVTRGGLGADVTAAGAGELLYSATATTYDTLAAGTSGYVLRSNAAAAPSWVDVNSLVIQNWTRSAEGILYPTTVNDGVAATSSATTVLTATQLTPALLAARLGGTTNATSVVINGSGQLGVGTTPTHAVELNVHTTAAGGISFGTDVELFRSAADTLSLASGDNLNLTSGAISISGTTVITSGRLVQAASGGVATPSFSFATDSNTGLYNPNADEISFVTGGTDQVLIDVSGNMGIGDATPNNKFTVGATSQFQVNSSGSIAAATGITSSGNITFSGLSAGATDSVVTENTGLLEKRAIDSRVWGSGLTDGVGTTNYNAYWTDANTLAAEQYVSVTRGGLGADVTAAGIGELLYSTGTAAYDTLASGTSGYVLQSNGAAAPSWVNPSAIVDNYWTRSAQGVVSPSTLNDVVAATSSATTVLTATQQTASLLAARIGGTTNATSVVIDGNGQLGVGDITPGAKFAVGPNSEFQVNSAGAIAAATGITSSGDITFSGMGAGSTDTVITASTGLLQTRTIDSRVWGSSLIDGTGTTGYSAYWTDANTLGAEQYVSVTRGGLGGNMTAVGAGEIVYSTGTTTYDSLASGTSGYLLQSTGAGAPTWTNPSSIFTNYWTRSAQGIVYPTTVNDGIAATSSATTVLTATQQNASLLAARLGGTTSYMTVGATGNIAFTNGSGSTITASAGLSLDGTGAVTLGGTNSTSTTIGRAGTDATINGGNIILGSQANAATEAVRADRALTMTQEGSGNVTITNSGVAQDFTADRTWTLGWTGQLAATRGGTGFGTYAVGDMLYADTTTTLNKLADVATGNVLLSGGIGVAPAWGKVNLTTAVSGILPIANGGTNSSTALTNGRVIVSSGGSIGERAALATDTLLIGNATTGLAPIAAGPGTIGQILVSGGAGVEPSWSSTMPAGTTISFTDITSGTNIQAAMVVSTGASLTYSAAGTINASSLQGATWEAPGTIGSTTPNTGAFTTLSANAVGNALTLSGIGANIAFTGAADAQITTAANQDLLLNPGGTGNVGIGNTTATAKLTITNPNVTGSQILLRSSRAAIVNNNVLGGIDFSSDDTTNAAPGSVTARIQAIATATHTAAEFATELAFSTTTGVTMTEVMRMNATGNVGIRNTTPSHKLTIASTIDTENQLALRSNLSAITAGEVVGGMVFVSNDTNLTAPGTQTAAIQALASATHNAATLDTDLVFSTTSVLAYSEKMRIEAGGNVGIGVTNPAYRLDVAGGDINFTGALRLNGDAGTSGYLLTSSGAALPTWSSPAALGVGLWLKSAQNVIYPATLNDVVAATSSATTVLTATQQTAALLAARIGGTTDATSVVIDGNGNIGVGVVAPAGRLDLNSTSNTAATLLLTNNTATTLGAGINTTGVLDLQSTSLTTGNFMNLEVNGLTSGQGINLTSTSVGLTTGNLLNVDASGNPGTSWTGTLGSFEYLTSTSANINGSGLKVGIIGAGAGNGTALNVSTGQTGATAYALRVNDDGTYTDSTPFVVDAVGNVGVGIAAPIAKLDILAGAARSGTHAAAPSLYLTAAMGTGEAGYAAGNVEFRHDNGTQGIGFGYHGIYQAGSNANEVLHIQSKGTGNLLINNGGYGTGNVGIGTTPVNKLQVKSAGTGPGVANGGLAIQTTADGVSPSYVYADLVFMDNTARTVSKIGSFMNTTLGGGLYFVTNDNYAGSGTERMRILANGNVGIGTAAPNYKLDVGPMGGTQTTTSGAGGLIRNNAAADTSPYTQARLVVYGGTTVDTGNWGYFGYGSDASLREVYAKTAAGAPKLWGTTSAMDGTGAFTETMRLTTGGNLSVGTTTTTSALNLQDAQTDIAMGHDADATQYNHFGFTSGYYGYWTQNATWTGTQWNYVAGAGYGGQAVKTQEYSGTWQVDTAVGGVNPVAWNTRLFIANDGRVGLGTATPGATNRLDIYNGATQLMYVNTSKYLYVKRFYDIDATSYYLEPGNAGIALKIAGSIEMNTGESINPASGSISITTGAAGTISADKITANTIDPPYWINGTRYATYAPSMIGVNEEIAQSAQLTATGTPKLYKYVIDFDNLTEGSPLWLYSRVIDLDANMSNLQVLVSSNHDARVFYKKDLARRQLIFFGTAPAEISYRLTAPRFDQAEHGHVSDDQLDSMGLYPAEYLLNNTPANATNVTDAELLASIETAVDFSLTDLGAVAINTDMNTATVTLGDANSNLINRFTAYTEAVIGKLRAGFITTKSLTAEDITATNATVSGTLTVENTSTKNLEANTSRLGKLLAQEATISGNLNVQGKTALGELSSETLTVAQNATISGSITATDLTITGTASIATGRLAYIEAKLAQLETVKANTAELTIATVSGMLYADNIADFDAKVAQTFRQPSLLANLLNQDNLPIDLGLPQGASQAADLKQTLAELNLSDSDVVITPSALFVKNYFELSGNGFIAGNLGIGKTLVIGNGLVISQDAIAYQPENMTVDTTFSIQPAGKGTLALMGGILKIVEGGKVEVNGELWVSGNINGGKDLQISGEVNSDGNFNTKGTLASNTIKPLNSNQALQVKVSDQDAQSGEITRSRFEIVDELGTPVATISADGKAKFASLSVNSENISATGSGTLNSSQSAGRARLTAGQTEIIIKSEQIHSNTLIYVTPLSSSNNQVLYVKAQTPEDPGTATKEGEFRVGVDTQIATDLEFNWWIVN